MIAGLGSNERSVNRIIQELGEAGLIDYDRRILKVHSSAAVLAEMSQYK